MGTAPMRNGDLIRHELASGGGWGNPLERDPDMVLSDLLDEKISIDHAREIYGVIFINTGTMPPISVDLKETEQLRKAMMSEEGV